jgi:predicted RNA binding protein YcfA (HicA-like mRNA interferase family)
LNVGMRRKLRRMGLEGIAKTARSEGWDVDWTRGGHIKFTHKSGVVVYGGSTPSDYRAARNLLANLRQVERGETPR